MNGYEGRAQAFLKQAQEVFAGKRNSVELPPKQLPQQSSDHNPLPSADTSSSTGYVSPYNQDAQVNPGSASPFRAQRLTAASAPIPLSSLSAEHIALTTPLWDVRRPGSRPLHPAIRPQYGGPAQQQQHNARRPSGPSQERRPSAPKAPAFHKQSHSPIPLPPYVQKMAASTSKSSPLSRPPQQANNTNTDTPKPAPEQSHSSTPSTSGQPSPLQQSTANDAALPVQQPSVQQQPPVNPVPERPTPQREEKQSMNPFAHHSQTPMSNIHTNMAMHSQQRDSWSPHHGVYQGQSQTPQYQTAPLVPHHAQYPPVQSIQPHLLHSPTTYQGQSQSPPSLQPSTPVMHQPQHSPMPGGYHHYQTPSHSVGQHYQQHPYHHPQQQPQPQSQLMYQHQMHGSDPHSPVDSYPPPPQSFTYDYPLPPATEQPEYEHVMSEYPDLPQEEDSQAFLQKMMMNLKRASGQLDTSPT